MTKSIVSREVSVGLPGYYYFEPDIFALELRSLWRNTWQFVGRESDVPNPGDYLTCVLGEQPLMLIRTANGELQALHNVCPHRGARLLENQGNCSFIRCPYHAWTYDLEGNLLGVPQAKLFPGLNKSNVYLSKARVDSWGGFIFVNPEPEGESLSSYLAGFPEYLEQYEQAWDELIEVDRWSYEESINWKFIVENYAEDYHFSTAHAHSLQFFDFPGIRTTTTGRHCQVYVPYADTSDEKYQGLSWTPQNVSYQGYIFPNMMVNTAKDHVSVFRLFPLTPTSTRTEVLLYQTPMQMQELPYQADVLRPQFDHVMEEDFAVCRLLQANVHSSAYRVTQLAVERELGIAHFYNVLSEYL